MAKKKEKRTPRWIMAIALVIALLSALVNKLCKRKRYMSPSPANPD